MEYASDREFGLGMIVADSNKLQLSFILDSDSQVRAWGGLCWFRVAGLVAVR